ncbi:MAG: hypothetical protein V7731_02190 [Amphritea sp.]
MIRVLLTSLLALLVSGCLSTIQESAKATDTSYYKVDLKDYTFCRGNSRQCHNLNAILSATEFAQPIERAYNQKVTGPNYRASLIRMMLNPQDGSYEAEKLTANGRFYKLPKNEKTDTVWKSMTALYQSLYNDDN